MVINLRRNRVIGALPTGERRIESCRPAEFRLAQRYRCWFNGRDVTNECFYVDSRRGLVRLMLRNDEGRFYLTERGEIATEERRGTVKLRRRIVGYAEP